MKATGYRMAAAAVVATGLTAGLTDAAAADTSTFVGTWGASPVAPLTSQELVFPLSATVSVPLEFAAQTIRQRVHPSLDGKAARIRLSNQFGKQPITFKSIYIGQTSPEGVAAITPGTQHQLLFGGKDTVTLAPGERRYSDPVDIPVKAFEDMTVSFYLPDPTGPATQHTLANQIGYLALGDHAKDDAGTSYLPSGVTSFFLTDVEVDPIEPAGSIAFIGDSVTDGFLYTTINGNHRYTDFFARRLQGDPLYRNLSVVNEGISGNRILKDNIGPSALHRLDSDALSLPNVKAVVLEAGINDIADPPFIGTTDVTPATADEVIAGMKQFADRVHAAGKKFYAATITPTGDLTDPAGPPFPTYSLPAVNDARQKINAWIRTGGAADGVLDFDKILADPSNPNHTRAQYKGADGVHPNDAGYEALGNSIDLTLFKGLVAPAKRAAGTAGPAATPAFTCTTALGSRPLKTALVRGLKASSSCTRSATLSATLTVSAASAKALKLPSRTVAVGRATRLKSKRSFSLHFTKVARTRLKRAKTVRLSLKVVATSSGAKKLTFSRATTVRR